ncbi:MULTISPECIES: SCO family protein [unclassified Pseudomonas]|uniref:SCO family protein n=1 Tax=unclassified Pseudomonas TaxID=196821 RepID=UPI0019438834|nr:MULTISPECIES: SCO family protein [unclassified Pseudomonas]MDC0688498.1 SCO family protein [Mitsuaria sp. RG]MCE0914037.1 SCO family protein [Pseudomonas sp. NMI760_13]MCF1487419.1 SCO family protein [Pseudomonas sp. AA27]MCP8631974.1 SCO family protein [Pseudomonas sp. DVZ6]MDD7783309.1 SCO family protein [Pseudomonas sp. DVZ24]
MTRLHGGKLLGLSLLLASNLALAHAGHDHGGQPEQPPAARQEKASVRFADVALLDQDGMPVRLEQDLVGDHLVVMGFIYTSCTTVCPVVSSIMSKVQQQLGGRVGEEIRLVSISVDPQRDDSKRLAGYARAFQHGPGWSWLTGSPYAISETLKGLGSFSANLSEHPPLILVGDGRSGHWTRYYGFTDPNVLIGEINRLSARRVHAKSTAIAGQEVRP